MIKAFKYALNMLDVKIFEGKIKIFGDNNAFVINISCPNLTLSKNHHCIKYHYVEKYIIADIGLFYRMNMGDNNMMDLFNEFRSDLK